MQPKFRLYRRSNCTYYVQNTATGGRESLGIKDRDDDSGPDTRTSEAQLLDLRLPVMCNARELSRQAIESFLALRFLQRKENLLSFGNPGLGKTHLANAIDDVNRLQTVVVTHSLPAALLQYTNPDLLVLDEQGYLSLDQHGGYFLSHRCHSIVLGGRKLPHPETQKPVP